MSNPSHNARPEEVSIMTDAEFETLQQECAEYVKRTTFEPTGHDARDAFEAHAEHAEQSGSWS